jgi:hypothetical protein
MMGLRPMALWAINPFHPGEHATVEIFHVGETCRFEDHAGLPAAIAAAAIANDFLVLPFIDIIGFHHADATQGQQNAADAEFGMLGGFTNIHKVERFAGIEPGFYFFDGDGLHNIFCC